jgi:ATP-dependent protease ClpP protease subunit
MVSENSSIEKKIVYINFFDAIDPIKVNKFIQFTIEAIRIHDPTDLYFFIASNGGDVDSGFVLYNFLVSLQSKMSVTTHNTGTIDSIANVIFVGGQIRFAAPNASFLFHGVSMNFGVAQNRTALKEALSRLEGMENRIAHTLSKHTKLTETELTALFTQGEGKDVNFALDKGIIHEIKIPSVPQGAIHLAMTF